MILIIAKAFAYILQDDAKDATGNGNFFISKCTICIFLGNISNYGKFFCFIFLCACVWHPKWSVDIASISIDVINFRVLIIMLLESKYFSGWFDSANMRNKHLMI